MKPLLALGISLTPVLAFPQWNPDPSLNTMVRDGAGINATTPLMSEGPDGSTYISWFEIGSGGYELRMQRLDELGFALWAPGGLVVSDHPQNSALFRYDLATDNEGNAIVAFQDERTGALRPVVYKLAPDGVPLWGSDGLELTDGLGGTGLAPVIGVLDNNNVVVAWNGDSGGNGYIPFRYIIADGTVSPAAGIIDGPEAWTRPKVIAQGDAFCIQCVRQTGNFPFTNTLFVRRYDANASEIASIQLSTRTISFFYFPEPVPDGHGGFYLAFNTGNPGNASLTDVYLQHMRADGGLWNAEGVELMTGTGTQRFGGPLARIDDDAGVLVPIQVTNTAQSSGGIHVQRIDTSGMVFLGPDGVELLPQTTDLPSPFGATATLDGAVITYSTGGFGAEHIGAARVDLSGTTTWTPAQLLLSTANSNKDDGAAGALWNDQLVMVWQDDRMSSGIYAQAITSGGLIVTIEGVPASDAPDPGDLSVLQDASGNWILLRNAAMGPFRLRVFDATGRLESEAFERIASSTSRFALPALTPGVHVAELVCGSHPKHVCFVIP